MELHTVTDNGKTLGFLAIDSMIAGRCCGGLRMLPDITPTEMTNLARAMTLKYGFLGLPQGGAKAGVIGDPEASFEERHERLLVFGRTIEPLLRNRRYAPHADMGTTNGMIREMLESLGIKVKRRELRGNNSGYYTALSVIAGIQQGARHIGLDLSRASVAIEGFGKVGSALGGLLDAAGVKVVAVSTTRGALYNPRGLDINRLAALAKQMGSEFIQAYKDAEQIQRAALLELPVDVLCPCARSDSIHTDNVNRIAAKLISPGANNPVTTEAERVLEQRGVLCLPDFVTNCGGVLGGTMEFAMHNRATIERVIGQQLGARIARLLQEAARQKKSPRELAEEESQRRFVAMQRAAEHPTLKSRFFALGLECHRRGWLPGVLVQQLSLRYFEGRASGAE